MNETELKKYILAQASQGSPMGGALVCGRIYGPYAKNARRNILQAIRGEKVPASKCGATAVREALFERFKPEGGCLAERESALDDILRS